MAGSLAGDYRNGAASTTSTPKAPKTPTSQLHTLKQPKSNLALRGGSSMGFSRPGSSLDRHMEEEPMPAPYHHQNYSSSPIDSGIGMARSEEMDNIIASLKAELADKDRQLQGQATSLLEMEASFAELQNLMNGSMMSPRSNSFEDADVSQLRALLREKNEKITHLTAEFDAHRADFRSTIDTLELASSETERVYEKRVADLMEDIRELQDRNEDVDSVARQLKQLEELVAELEEGLEDARRGEAEARGEVEFLRGEVERSREELRREREKSAAAVANAAVGKMLRNGQDEVEKKDDEIRGLKAIIHSLSRDSVALDDNVAPNDSKANGGAELVKERQNGEKLSQEISELQNQIKNKVNREEELEREIEDLRKKRDARTSASSEKTVSPWGGRVVSGGSAERIGWRSRQLSGSGNSLRKLQLDTNPIKEAPISEGKNSSELTPIDSDADSTVPWCEICETGGHDILTCTNMFGSGAGGPASAGPNGSTTAAAAAAAAEQEEHIPAPSPLPLRRKESVSLADGPSGSPPATSPAPPTTISSPTTEDDFSIETPIAEKKKSVHLPYLSPPPPVVDTGSSPRPLAGKESGVVEMDKWCALCERDGHDSVDCPEEADY